jgi:hypothetical protein
MSARKGHRPEATDDGAVGLDARSLWPARRAGGLPDAAGRHGQNTSLLLWAVWAEAADPRLLPRAAEAAHRWEATALVPCAPCAAR